MNIFEKIDGRKLELKYDETGYHFEMSYMSDNDLKWEAKFEVQDGEATEGIETYYSYQISDGIYNVNWIEKDGLTVSQILNFNTKTVYAFLTWSDDSQRGGRGSLLQKGTFNFI